MKKRLLTLMLATLMATSLIACGGKNEETVVNMQESEKTGTETTTTVEDDSAATAENDTATTTDPVEGDQAGVSGPADEVPETEEPVEEVTSNTVTLMTADGSAVLKEFELSEGYSVVSGDGTNRIEIATDKNAYVRSIEIFSGLNVDIISAMCGPKNPTIANSIDGFYYTKNTVDQFLESFGVSNDALIDSTTVTYTQDTSRHFWVDDCYYYGPTEEGMQIVVQNFSQDTNNEIDEYRIFDYYAYNEWSGSTETVYPVNETWTIRITIDEGDRTNIQDTHYNVDAGYASEIIANVTGIIP